MIHPAELERLLGEYYARSGREGADAFIQEHPEHADALRKHLGFLDLVSGAFHEEAVPERIGIYRIEAELGSGGMGTVYRATSESDGPAGAEGTSVAIKLMHPHLFRASGFFKRFLREADLGRRINHPNVVRTLDVDAIEQGGSLQHFLVMEYVEGQTLRSMLDELARVPEELARHLGLEICKALSAIHRVGAIHRDLKPENVLITPKHGVKVMDLGVAQLVDEQVRLSKTGAFVGSLQYAAPEQFRSGREVDFRADLHGLGLLLYELCCGESPYFHEDAHVAMQRILTEDPRKLGERTPQVTPFLEEVVHGLLQKDPDDRIGSADELLAVLSDAEASTWWEERAKQLRQATSRPLRRVRIPRETAVYGREAELEKLGALFDAVKAGDGRVLLIDGEAGIGKTRLIDEFVAGLHRAGEDLNFLFASYPPGGAATAAGAFSAAFREQLGGEDLEESLGELVPQTPLLIPALAALLRGDAVPDGVKRLTKDSLQTCFVHLTRGLAAARPTILWIDDLHFAPQEGRALFTSLALAVPEHPIFLIGTSRPGLPEDWTSSLLRIEHATSLSIPRLGAKDLVHLLGDSFKSDRLAEELAGKIALKSDGNPFFVFEIIQGLREGQFIARRPDGSWHTTQLIEEIQVPSSILDLVNARIADLPEDSRTLLDVAACWGYEFDPVLIGETLGMGRIRVLRMLAQIERAHRLVRSLGRNYVFDHHQVQEALYGSLNEQLREEYHSLLAETLEHRLRGDAGSGPPPPQVSVQICDHYLRAGRASSALPFLDQALEHLEGGQLHSDSLRLLDGALDGIDSLEEKQRTSFLVRKAECLRKLAQSDKEGAVLEELGVIASRSDDQSLIAKIEGLRGLHLRVTGHLDEALARHEVQLSAAKASGDRGEEVKALIGFAAALNEKARFDEARSFLDDALRIAEEEEDRAGRAQALGWYANVLHAQSRYEESLECSSQRLALAMELGDREQEAIACATSATIRHELGEIEAAIEETERTIVIFREVGLRQMVGHATMNLGNMHASLGRFEEAVSYLDQTRVIAREVDDLPLEANALMSLGGVHMSQYMLAEAKECFEQSASSFREVGRDGQAAVAILNLGLALTGLGDLRGARRNLKSALSVFQEAGMRRPASYALHGLATVDREEGNTESAVNRLEEALAIRRELGYARGIADSALELADLLRDLGKLDDARVLAREALAVSRKAGFPQAEVVATGLLACLPGGTAARAVAAFEKHRAAADNAPTRYIMYLATKDVEHLYVARKQLNAMLECSESEESRQQLRASLLHRSVTEALEKHGAADIDDPEE